MKIVLIPLDDRPCNCKYPVKLFNHDDLNIVVPDKLGYKKNATDTNYLKDFLLQECLDADGLVLSIDMLVYGGLVPSRIHHEDKQTLINRLETIKEIKKQNQKIKIYAFNCIMRCPNYSSDDEEPDFYGIFGKQIHDLGEAIHKKDNNLINQIKPLISDVYLNDYINRRSINLSLNIATLELVKEGLIDELVIPQDDSSPFGFAAMDRNKIKDKIKSIDLEDKVLSYPGADEVEMSLISRMLVDTKLDRKPKIYIDYLNEEAKNIIPLYEGGPLKDSLESHIKSAGCTPGELNEADIVLMITAPGKEMKEAWDQPVNDEGYNDRKFDRLISSINNYKQNNKIVTIGDNAYANGGDLIVLDILNNNNSLLTIDGYAGWNTSANSVGTALSMAINSFVYKECNKEFLVSRYIEDFGFCSAVRKKVTDMLPCDMSYFDVKETNGLAASLVKRELESFSNNQLDSINSLIKINYVLMPWKRMFEIDLDITLEQIKITI